MVRKVDETIEAFGTVESLRNELAQVTEAMARWRKNKAEAQARWRAKQKVMGAENACVEPTDNSKT